MAWLLFATIAVTLYTAAAAVDCPSGWLVHGQKCYHFSHDIEDWIEAGLVCQRFGAYLVEIESQEEDAFIRQEVDKLARNYWLGGDDLEEEGIWVWDTSRNPITEYVHWEAGEPNDSGSNENCLMMRSGYVGWNDGQCRSGFRYICEKEPGSGTEIVG